MRDDHALFDRPQRRFFDVLGTSAILGRTFAPDDDRRGGGPTGPVAVRQM